MSLKRTLLATAVAGGIMAMGSAHATNGYFAHGYGVKSKSMGGGGVAFSANSAMTIANNPATLTDVDDQVTFDVSYFRPIRGYDYETRFLPIDNVVDPDAQQLSGILGVVDPQLAGFLDNALSIALNALPTEAFSVEGTGRSDREAFYIPSLAASYALTENDSFGIAMYGNGGMNTDYPAESGNYLGFGGDNPQGTFGSGRTGVNLEQLFITPTYARKLFDDTLSIGISPVIARQKFRAYGLDNFNGSGEFGPLLAARYPNAGGDRPGSFSTDSDNMNGNGHDKVWGYGGKIGLTFSPTDNFTLGASYQSRIHMDEFEEYSGLFAEGGSFDIPPTWTVGMAADVTDTLTLTFDYQRIKYEDVKSISNPSMDYLFQCTDGDSSKCLGGEDGIGFGWDDINVYKLGMQWQATPKLQLRAGWNRGDNPVSSEDALFNTIAPGVTENHYTAGFSYAFNKHHQMHGAVMYAPEVRVDGKNELLSDFTVGAAEQDLSIYMKQYEATVGYTYKF
ncbi:outer membrane protein transport protein [Guyparkeria hydrothermalis]|uniref:OmpP1/FadL family transporter n=1 Tax=Guyparkeria hydrothermalis TaxID=923 RepID=UPI0020206B1F|nr:outer membrane protein transport protein [Guyparkeria hydrothermalis]MCL7743697.1 outer membrane protein transport protein [Guyparkeria hydrothermalis]